MFKRSLLALTFVAALGAASVATSTNAVAHGCGYGGYGYRAAYYPSYASYYAYPRVAYYPGSYAPAYPVYYGGGHRHHRHHHHDGITLSFGF